MENKGYEVMFNFGMENENNNAIDIKEIEGCKFDEFNLNTICFIDTKESDYKCVLVFRIFNADNETDAKIMACKQYNKIIDRWFELHEMSPGLNFKSTIKTMVINHNNKLRKNLY